MTILETTMDIFGGSGGPNHNAIPMYSDNHAPNGGQVIGPDGRQLMLVNSEESGAHYITVNPFVISPEENIHSRFVTFKSDGVTPNYIRMWIFNPETGHGEEYAPGVDLWGEYSHLRPYTPQPPQPEIMVDGTITAGNISAQFHVGEDGDWIVRI